MRQKFETAFLRIKEVEGKEKEKEKKMNDRKKEIQFSWADASIIELRWDEKEPSNFEIHSWNEEMARWQEMR